VEPLGEHVRRSIPAGTEGVIIERYSNPEGYDVNTALPSDKFVVGYMYYNVIVYPGQFIVRKSAADEQ
jgi:hypothetical protein